MPFPLHVQSRQMVIVPEKLNKPSRRKYTCHLPQWMATLSNAIELPLLTHECVFLS